MIQRIKQLLENANYGANVAAFKTDNGLILGAGETVGGGIEGWAPGAIYIDTDAAAGAQVKINEGSATTASWASIGSQSLALADDETLTVGTGSDAVLSFDGTSLKWVSAAAATPFLIGGDAKLFNTTLKGTLTVGKDDTGHDVKLFGATAGSYLLWDESADKLIINAGTADLGTSCEADAYTVGGVAGADHDGVANTFTVVKGIVTAISQA